MAVACIICLDGSGALLRKGCACRGSSSWAHAECMARAAAAQLPRRGERAWSECQTCGQHFAGQMTVALACLLADTRSSLVRDAPRDGAPEGGRVCRGRART